MPFLETFKKCCACGASNKNHEMEYKKTFKIGNKEVVLIKRKSQQNRPADESPQSVNVIQTPRIK